MIIIGEKRRSKVKNQRSKRKELFVTVRSREGKDLGMMEVNKFINQLKSQIENFFIKKVYTKKVLFYKL